MFIALEGVGGCGKSTLAAVLARRLTCPVIHTAPEPLVELQPYINRHAKPLPHLMFYLAAVLHSSDLVRDALVSGNAIADRYISSVIANHAAVHNSGNTDARTAIAPFLDYVLVPDLTVYLHASPETLSARGWRRFAQTKRRPQWTDVLARAQQRFDEVAAEDPTALHLQTDDQGPEQIAELVVRALPTHVPAKA